MNGELVCCWTSQLRATASVQFATLLTRAPIQIQRKARWRRTSNMERRLIARGLQAAEPARFGGPLCIAGIPAAWSSQRAFPGVGERNARDPPRHPHLAVVLGPARVRLQRLARPSP